MMLIRSLLLISLLLAGGVAQGAEFVAKVIAVLDGDTVLVKRANGLKKIRLAGIDAPEKAQTLGDTSRRSLADMVLGKQVKVASEAVDQYGRMVAHLSVDGLDVNAEQIRRGMAWEYSRFHNDRAMLALQEEARREPRGLWALSDPMPPWEWRKLHPSTLSEPSPHVGTSAAVDAPTADPVCASKKRCSQMTSCEEARYYLNRCGGKLLDGDGDGLPCEQLCAPQGKAP
ncbi:nuclease [Ferrigenium kumadai]|uniref:Nuclease n=1 Tax=Ferrigenium kumadai TaxID=1682490 RepID=A0AAN1T1Z1_9PROT|nr:thermonuclease family protein [Ferrigenium kumadai]BBJ00215.1 nuclease [Ferrigenium kumadai]